MAVRLKKYSFRFSEELFNSRLAPKSEIEQILYAACVDFSKLNRKEFNKILNDLFLEKGWEGQPRVSPDMKAYSKFDFQKSRIAVEVQFGHASFLGTDLLKFQMASYSNLDLIDFGVYITTTKAMQKFLTNQYGIIGTGRLTLKRLKNICPISKVRSRFPFM